MTEPSFLCFDGMTWPNPTDPHDTQWRLIHAPATLSREDQLRAASAMAAYAALIDMTALRRADVVRGIRAAGSVTE